MPSIFASVSTRMSAFLAIRTCFYQRPELPGSNLFLIELILRCAIIKPLGLFFRSFPRTQGPSSVVSYTFIHAARSDPDAFSWMPRLHLLPTSLHVSVFYPLESQDQVIFTMLPRDLLPTDCHQIYLNVDCYDLRADLP